MSEDLFPTFALPVPVVRGVFGREVQTFQTQVRPDQIEQLLGHDPRSKNWKKLPDDYRQMYEYLQRKTEKRRRESASAYIEDRFSTDSVLIGAFPAISIGMTNPPRFCSVKSDEPSLRGVGTLQLELSVRNKRILLDGLARVTGALDLFDAGAGEDVTYTFPVTIFAPTDGHQLTLRQLGQLFHDFNFLQAPVKYDQAIALDQSDPYVLLTHMLAKRPVIAENGGMEERAASLGAKSTALVVQRVLLRFVRGASEGRRFQESRLAIAESPNLTRENLEAMAAKLEGFLGAVVSRMGERFKSRDSLHLSAPGWQVMGLVFHDMEYGVAHRLDDSTRSEIIDKLAAIDWSRHNPDWIGLVGEPERDKITNEIVTDTQGRQRVALSRAGRTTIASLLKYVRSKTGLDELVTRADEAESVGA